MLPAGGIIALGATPTRVISRESITTKSTKDTKLDQIVKFFVIFVYFVVDKFYIALKEPGLPLTGRPPGFSLTL